MANNKHKGPGRLNTLASILGRDKASELERAISGWENILAGAGVQHKSLSSKNKGALEDMKAAVAGIVSELTDDEELQGKISDSVIATVMGTLSSMGEEPAVEEVVEDVEMAEDEEDDELVEQLMSLTEQVKSLTEENQIIVEGVKELVPAFVGALKIMQDLAPLSKGMGEFADIRKRMTSIEKQLSGKPRRASQDKSTEIEPDESVQQEIQKGTRDEKKKLGIPVNMEVKYDY